MRRTWLVLCLCVWVPIARAETSPALHIGDGDIDIAARTIHFSLATVAKSVEMQVFTPEGQLLHEAKTEYASPPAGTRLDVSWPDLGKPGENFRMELKFTDADDNWVGFQVIRFYIEIPHREVIFASGKWDISAKEEEKLVEPLRLLQEAASKYQAQMHVQLYVAGHTDTVGKDADNQVLSAKRARAIADYFVAHGLSGVPVFVRGFGEGALKVKTGDNVAEAKNRRAQYIISSFTPEIAGPGSWTQYR